MNGRINKASTIPQLAEQKEVKAPSNMHQSHILLLGLFIESPVVILLSSGVHAGMLLQVGNYFPVKHFQLFFQFVVALLQRRSSLLFHEILFLPCVSVGCDKEI